VPRSVRSMLGSLPAALTMYPRLASHASHAGHGSGVAASHAPASSHVFQRACVPVVTAVGAYCIELAGRGAAVANENVAVVSVFPDVEHAIAAGELIGAHVALPSGWLRAHDSTLIHRRASPTGVNRGAVR
jgi:hypothetical protein